MFSVKTPRPLLAAIPLLFLGGAMLVAAPAAAETLVVRSSGPSAGSFTPGRKLADGAAVTLKAGDVLTLLDGRGTRTLRGPGVFGASGPTASGSVSIASFIATRSPSRARTGAVRGGQGAAEPRSPNLWYVDIRNPGARCIADPAAVKLWRPASNAAATFTLTGETGKGSLSFEAGQSVANWPAGLPVTDGAGYELSGADLPRPVAIRFTLLPPAEGLQDTASTLIAHKCDAQLNLLIETVALPDTAVGTPG